MTLESSEQTEWVRLMRPDFFQLSSESEYHRAVILCARMSWTCRSAKLFVVPSLHGHTVWVSGEMLVPDPFDLSGVLNPVFCSMSYLMGRFLRVWDNPALEADLHPM